MRYVNLSHACIKKILSLIEEFVFNSFDLLLLQKVTGEFCECDNFSCDRNNNQLCSGNGNCVCGQCECNSNWSGKSCECSTNKDTCRLHGLECSGHVSFNLKLKTFFV